MNSSVQEPVSGKGSTSLAVWMVSSVAFFVLMGSLALVWAFELRIEREEQRAFEELARVNTSFLERSRLPQTAKMAEQLGEIIGAQIFFWYPRIGDVTGKAGDSLPGSLAFKMNYDGKVSRINKGHWMVGLPGPNETKVIFIRPALTTMHAMSRSDTWFALGVFWFLSLALGWGMSRRITGPLRGMAKSLALVGTEHVLPELPVSRRDEVGQLARTLNRTHQSLREERERRRAAERHALLGQMTASLAHEVRNPVAAIRLHAQLLEHALPEEATVSRHLIESEAGRIEEVLGQWLNYARPQPTVLTEMDVVDSLLHAIRLMEPQAHHAGVRIEMMADTACPLSIPADRHRIQQVFGNLLRNAVQAMPSGGTIQARIMDEADRVAVMFEDEGRGFSSEALARAGEPFYSEKEGGMGLGLAVAMEICLAHGGGLVVENRVDGGAAVRAEFSKHETPPSEANTLISNLR